jgi:hypothetical protein
VRRRVPTQKLRGSDAVTLEIMTGDLVAKPLGQVSLANVADLFALAELEGLPPVMRRRLAPYRQRIGIEIGDLPAGPPIEGFIEELLGVEPGRIPMSLREALIAESERPKWGELEQALFARAREHWESAPPMEFELEESRPVMKKVAAEAPRDDGPARPGQARAARIPKERAAPTPRAPKEPEVDPERAAWVRQVCMERLVASREKGLAEQVLVAGIRHRAREVYGDLTPREVVLVLKSLEATGRVKHTAQRWMIMGRLSW